MSDTAAKLIRMANQIAMFFRSYPHDQAVAGVQEHIRAFWTPGMRTALVAERDAATLDPLVREAVVAFSRASSPAAKETAGPEALGQVGSNDAG